MSHSNISIFIPFLGCPMQCSFCNQIHITSCEKMPDEKDIDNAVEIAKKSKNYDKNSTQLAYFGGSFTAIDEQKMLYYLKIGKKHIDCGNVNSIRISTRPDCINQNILDLLKEYGVKSIELGAQSLFDEVLDANSRGHSANDVFNACTIIRNNGFELGLQMMTGLYKSNDILDFNTAEKFVKIHPDTVRVYPTIVLENTKLGDLYKKGLYSPQTIESATSLGAEILKLFYDNNINVIRFGLHSIDESSYLSGPWHPSLSEIAQSKIYLKIILERINEKGFYDIYVNSKELSKAIGQKKSNVEELKKNDYFVHFSCNERLKKYEIDIKKG